MEVSLLVAKVNGFSVGWWDEEADGRHHSFLAFTVAHPPLDTLAVIQ